MDHLRHQFGELILAALPLDGSTKTLAALAEATGLSSVTVSRTIGQMPGSITVIRRQRRPTTYRRASGLCVAHD